MINVKLVILGHFPYAMEIKKVKNWKSEVFRITEIAECDIIGNSDGPNWEFLDVNIEQQLPARGAEDIIVAVTNVPIEDNYYARRFSNNRGCISYHGMTEILSYNNIPLENLLLRMLYSVSLVYKHYGNRIPTMTEDIRFTHDETRGCLFDMDGIRTDIIYSTHNPQLCGACIHNLCNNSEVANRIEYYLIDTVQKELKRINKGLFYKITDFIKKHPIYSIIISSVTAVILSILGSIVSSFIYDQIK